jgi:hypothetical protein
MKTASGIFSSRSDAEKAMRELFKLGLTEDQLSLLAPGKTDGEQDTVPTEDGEQPGMGKVIGGVVGGALGLSGGLPLGMVISSLLFPGVGPVLAIGFITAAIAGSVGAAGGAAAGGALEYSLTEGLPRDELYFYEDALRQGRTILILRTDDDEQLEAGRKILADGGAESIDAAREKWWIGLRDAEAESYDPSENFLEVESTYRKGFEAALDMPNRVKSYGEAQNNLKLHYPNIWDMREFRAGYERGHQHAQSLMGRSERISGSSS